MKKRLILLLTIFITIIGSSAQQATSTQRLKFMGKSMDCSVSEMAAHLKTKGCKIKAKEEGLIIMSGTFQGYKDCIFVLSEDYNILKSCTILLPDIYDNWTTASDYNRLVKKFTQKYGVPQISKSEFDENPYSDYEKLRFGRCLHRSVFFIEGSTIDVSISSKRVMIRYLDKIAIDKIEKIQQDEL